MKRALLFIIASALLMPNAQVSSEDAYNRSLDSRKEFIKELRNRSLASHQKFSEILSHGTRRKVAALIANYLDEQNKRLKREYSLVNMELEGAQEEIVALAKKVREEMSDERAAIKEQLSTLDAYERALMQDECQKMFDFILFETEDSNDRQELYQEHPRHSKLAIAKRASYVMIGSGAGLVIGLALGCYYIYSLPTQNRGSGMAVGYERLFWHIVKVVGAGLAGTATGWGVTIGGSMVRDYVHADLNVLALLAVGEPEELFGE